MPSEHLPEPWSAFLTDIDEAATIEMELLCIGGFAVSLYYGLLRPTADIDVADVRPGSATRWLNGVAGFGSALHQKHRVYLQIVSIASLPYFHEDRRVEIFGARFRHLRLLVLDPYDPALSKLTRGSDIDTDDVKYLARAQHFNLDLLERRYHEELRPYAIGPAERHDVTLQLWINAIREERNERGSG